MLLLFFPVNEYGLNVILEIIGNKIIGLFLSCFDKFTYFVCIFIFYDQGISSKVNIYLYYCIFKLFFENTNLLIAIQRFYKTQSYCLQCDIGIWVMKYLKRETNKRLEH